MGFERPIAVEGTSRRTGARQPVRLLVIDDSATTRAVFARVIAGEPDMEIAEQGSTAEECLRILATCSFDVILLDLHMPGRGGLEALPEIIAAAGEARILVVSTLTTAGAEPTLKALALGAADTLAKPQPGAFDDSYRARLIEKIRILGRTKGNDAGFVRTASGPPARIRRLPTQSPRIIAIGASTGGIHALGGLLSALPRRIGAPILITQHLPASFMDAFARQMQLVSGRAASVAVNGMELTPDEIFIAPGEAHLTTEYRASGGYRARLDRNPASTGCLPSVDPMFASVAEAAGDRALGVVLSGMGRDGTQGAGAIVDAGGAVFVQDEASSAVWGMPGSVAMAGLASSILPPHKIAERVLACGVRG